MITLYIKLQGAVRRLEEGKQGTYLNKNNKKNLVEKLMKKWWFLPPKPLETNLWSICMHKEGQRKAANQ